jgi:uncharacterized membrane protein YozB (DUF420 family)
MTIHTLPAVNATLNGLSATFLALGLYFIKRSHHAIAVGGAVAAFDKV